ncbi:MAG TPA: transposase, partial [Alphaproteobacteria bacterium]|nr:transposase [Alphaproteobacteria bacterium]
PPFASIGAGGLSRLAVRVLKAGVRPERIAPGQPQQNGRLERLHLTLLQDTAQPPARSLRQQLARFRAFQRLYNEERPHQALGNTPPADHYAPSPRRWDGVLRAPEYPVGHSVRRVRHNGEIKWRGTTLYINEALAGEPIGIEESDEGLFIVRYGLVELGSIDPRADRLRKPVPRARGFMDNPDGLPTTPPAQQPPQAP